MKNKVAVLGAGISGISTAVLLQYFGFKVTIYSPDTLSKNNSPYFASLYPSASIIPHSVYHPELISIFEASQSIFSTLLDSSFPGMKIHNHFELYTFDQVPPDYAKLIPEFSLLSDGCWHPKHPTIKCAGGWSFDCYFADWNIYFPELVSQFLKNGGSTIFKKIDTNTIKDLKEEIIVNCTGTGAHSLTDNESEPFILLGHLLKITGAPLLINGEGKTVSYNFTPGKQYYSDSRDNPLDVYCYPREDGWILGGSRFEGTLDKNGKWVSRDAKSEAFPPQVLQLNSEIIENTFGINALDFENIEHIHSYRYVRNKKKGLRLKPEEKKDKLILHNYGHGGAGVTLSWGCAYRILNTILQEQGKQTASLREVSRRLLFRLR